MIVGLTDIINFIAIFQLFVFTLFLCLKKPRRLSNILLAVFLSSQILILANAEFFGFYNYIYSNCPHLFYIGMPFFFIAAPSFYLYVKSLAFSDFKLNKKHILHLLPFLTAFLLITFTYHIYSAETKRALLANGTYILQTYRWLFHLSVHVCLLVYNIASLIILGNYRKKIKQEYSSVERINLSWLGFILYGFMLAWCTSIISFISYPFNVEAQSTINLINTLAFFFFFNFIFFKALIQPDIFIGIKEMSAQKRPFLSKKLEERYISKLLNYMDTEKPFMNPEITLFNLARKVSIPHRALSEIINNSLNQNFYDFINSYRIKESKRMLEDKENRRKTVLEILYAVGYNSKSSFNVAFKKHTRMTPSQFKKMHQN